MWGVSASDEPPYWRGIRVECFEGTPLVVPDNLLSLTGFVDWIPESSLGSCLVTGEENRTINNCILLTVDTIYSRELIILTQHLNLLISVN